MKQTELKTALLLTALLLTACGRKDRSASPPPVPATADKAILQLARSIENNEPVGAWHALPESFQNDLTETVSQFASAMDRDVWSAGTTTLGKLEQALSRQKRFFLNSDLAQMLGGRDAIEKDYDQVVKILSIIKGSDLMDLQKLRNPDIARILATTGADLMNAADEVQGQGAGLPGGVSPGEIKAAFAGMQAELLSQEDDSAVVNISTPGEEPEDVDFVRIEGKWIPADLAEDWSEMVQDMQTGIAQIKALGPAEKSQFMMMTTMANGILDQLISARSQEDFNAVLGGMMGMMMGGM